MTGAGIGGRAVARGVDRLHRRGAPAHVSGQVRRQLSHGDGGCARGGGPRVRGARYRLRRRRPAGRGARTVRAADRVPGRLVLVQRPGAGARGRGLRGAARAGGGRGGPVRSRQDDAGRPAAAVLRAAAGRHPDGRRSHHPVHPLQSARAHGHRVAGDHPAERQRAREHLLRSERLHAGAGAGGRARRQRSRLRLSAPRGLSHAPRRARHPALGRRAPADRDRTCAAARSAHPDSRRGDQRARHGVRAAGAGGHRPADGAPHDVRHRAPAGHRPTRQPDRGARRGADRRTGDARDAVRRRRAVPPAARHAVPHLIVISGFTIVRNAVTLDYPIAPAIRSILELCDEVVVNVGKSDDDTRDVVAGLGDPRVRIIDSVWDFSRGSGALARETNRAMAACHGAWGVYIQADEVLHETGAAALREKIREWNGEARVEGLLVDYHHFYGDFDTIATDRHWYRREVRAVRLNEGIRSYQDAQGFRVGDAARRLRARATGARMFHYGWARPPQSLRQKLVASQEVFLEQGDRIAARAAQQQALYWTPLLRRFTGSHPRAAGAWIAARRAATSGPRVGPRRLKLAHLRLYLSDWIERLTGARLFEYRNYVEV